jgi:hypothetical protein
MEAATLAGQQVQGGKTVEIRFPVSKYFQDVAAQATIKPRQDSTPWRPGMLGSALEAVRKEWPQTAKWPVAFAGMSGGAKRSGVLGVMLARAGSVNICGFYLSGINDDRLRLPDSRHSNRLRAPGCG